MELDRKLDCLSLFFLSRRYHQGAQLTDYTNAYAFVTSPFTAKLKPSILPTVCHTSSLNFSSENLVVHQDNFTIVFVFLINLMMLANVLMSNENFLYDQHLQVSRHGVALLRRWPS